MIETANGNGGGGKDNLRIPCRKRDAMTRRESEKPTHPRLSPRERIVRWIADAIASGKLKPGDAVPSVRELAATLGMAVNTAAAGLLEAERRRIIERRGPGAHKRFVPVAASAAPLASATVCVLGALGSFADGITAPRWSDSYLALELVPRLSAARKHVTILNGDVLAEPDLDALFRAPPAGMVVTGAINEQPAAIAALSRCRKAGLPVVVYGNAPELRSFDRAYVDHRAGEREITEWLLARGCRRIVPLFPSEPSKFWERERIEGYAEAMRAAGLEPAPCMAMGDEELKRDSVGRRRFRFFKALAVDAIIQLRRKGGVDALLCISDEWALVAIAAIRDLGLEPNRDILVAGYDNYTRGGQFEGFEAGRPIVTMDKRSDRTAADLAALLVARMDGALPPEPQVRTHRQELVVGDEH